MQLFVARQDRPAAVFGCHHHRYSCVGNDPGRFLWGEQANTACTRPGLQLRLLNGVARAAASVSDGST